GSNDTDTSWYVGPVAVEVQDVIVVSRRLQGNIPRGRAECDVMVLINVVRYVQVETGCGRDVASALAHAGEMQSDHGVVIRESCKGCLQGGGICAGPALGEDEVGAFDDLATGAESSGEFFGCADFELAMRLGMSEVV